MSTAGEPSADKIAGEFVEYLFDDFQGTRHVRQVASWIGLIVLGIEKQKDTWKRATSRQLKFERNGKRYKTKYNHKLGRGGIEVVEIEQSRGEPEIRTVVEIRNLDDARSFFQDADRQDW